MFGMKDSYQTQIGAVVDTNRVNDLPLNGRNVYDLAITLPGVSNTNFNTVSSNSGAFLNVNGSRTRQSTFMLDGAFNNDLFRNSGNSSPNPDAVQEFRLITSNFNAEFGRSPGAVFNVVLTRDGVELVPGLLMPTDSFGFGKVAPPLAGWRHAGSVVWSELPQDTPRLELSGKLDRKAKQYVLDLRCGKRGAVVQVPEPHAKG